MKKYSAILSAALISLLSANSYAQTTIVGPWMTGPLLAGGGSSVAPGDINVEFYTFVTDSFGVYSNTWKVLTTPVTVTTDTSLLLQTGIVKNLDIEAVVPYDFNSRTGQYDSDYGDLGLVLGYQFLQGEVHGWKPNMRFTVQETFPTAKYNNLNPNLNGTDSFGGGAYQTTLGLNIEKLCQFENGRFLDTRLTLGWTIPGDVNVRNINSYGGAFGTRGVVNLGSKLAADLAFQYTLTQHWVPAVDFYYSYTTSSSFRGTAGLLPSGLPAPNASSSAASFSIAPALEYNFNSHIGIIGGAWFTVTGENSVDFVSGVAAINIYY